MTTPMVTTRTATLADLKRMAVREGIEPTYSIKAEIQVPAGGLLNGSAWLKQHAEGCLFPEGADVTLADVKYQVTGCLPDFYCENGMEGLILMTVEGRIVTLGPPTGVSVAVEASGAHPLSDDDRIAAECALGLGADEVDDDQIRQALALWSGIPIVDLKDTLIYALRDEQPVDTGSRRAARIESLKIAIAVREARGEK